MRERLPVLDTLYADLTTTAERSRHPDEPPPEVNDGYAKLLFAYGYHRLENATRAKELEVAGRAQLEEYREDPVHAWLIDVFDARARDSVDATGELPAPLGVRLDGFDRVTRYKVDRFREASRIVGGGAVDAVLYFGSRRYARDIGAATASLLEGVDRSLTLADTAEDEAIAATYIEQSLQVSPEAIQPEAAARVLDRVLPRIERMADRRGLAYARAIALATHGAPARVPALTEQIAPFIAREAWNLHEILALLAESLAPDHQAELAELWKRVPASVHSTAEYLLGCVRLGVMPNRRDVVSACAARNWSGHNLRAATLDSFLARPFSERFADGWAGELFASTTDDLSTNSHFTYSVIYVVDRLVRGVLEP